MTTRSAPAAASSKPTRSSTVSIPERTSAPSRARAPNPAPPAAPAPGTSRRSRPVVAATRSAQWPSAASRTATSAGEGTLLRAIDGGRSRRPGEGVVDVGRHHEPHSGQPRGHRRQVQRGRTRERRATRRDRRTRAVEHPSPQRHREAGAHRRSSSCRPTPSTTSVQPGVHGRRHQFTGAERASGQRREPGRQPVQPRRVGQLHDRGPTPPGVRRPHRLPGRPGHGDRNQREPGGRGRGQGAVAAVGHRHGDHRRGRHHPVNAACQRCRDARGGQGSLELVAGHDDPDSPVHHTWSIGAGHAAAPLTRRARSSRARPARRASAAGAAGCRAAFSASARAALRPSRPSAAGPWSARGRGPRRRPRRRSRTPRSGPGTATPAARSSERHADRHVVVQRHDRGDVRGARPAPCGRTPGHRRG